MKGTGKNGKEKGFSLIEVVLALAILGVVGVSLMSFVLNSYMFSATTGTKSQASFLAQEKMETIRSMPFDQLLLKASSLNANFACPGGKAQAPLDPVSGFENITRSYHIECLRVQTAGYFVDLLKITVEARYGHADKHSVKLISYVKE